jgi:hypothetical protein
MASAAGPVNIGSSADKLGVTLDTGRGPVETDRDPCQNDP